ncbi:MAG: CotH kinase family protein [Planctomycetota bacterium]
MKCFPRNLRKGPAVRLCSAGVLIAWLLSTLHGTAPPAGAPADPARELFSGKVLRVTIETTSEGRESLGKEPRTYVPATVRVGDLGAWPKIGIKLKGAAGSFRELGDRPGLTLKLDKFGDPPDFYGLTKFHLNNAVQDGSWLSEWLGAQIFAAAGYPAPRVAHAHLVVDGRDLGLYVLREAFDQDLLLRCYGDASGNLYDGGFCQDIYAELEKDSGKGTDDRSDLRALREACTAALVSKDWSAIEKQVDIGALIDFFALEAMLAHWDGYAFNRNNYRLYFDPRDGLARFLPHGMDQLFGDAEAAILRFPPSLVVGAVLANPEWRKRYRKRVVALVPHFNPQKWFPRIDAMAELLAPTLALVSKEARLGHVDAIRDLKARVAARYGQLQTQSRAPEPTPVHFRGDKPQLVKGWNPAGETEGVVLRKKNIDGAMALQVSCAKSGEQVGGWRTSLLLARGRYRLIAMARADAVEAPAADEDGEVRGGVFLAVDDARSEQLFANTRWKLLSCEFEVSEFQREVELALRLRAIAGSASFGIETLKIARVSE